MTVFSGPGPDPADMLRRLRARPVSSWRHGDREQVMRSALQQLADLAADTAGGPRRAVPDVGAAALADQLAVLLAEARAAGVVLAPLLAELAAALGAEAAAR